MPLFYQHNINDAAELAVWHITEPEEFFTREVELQYTIPNPHKRLQHLAGRYLLKILDQGFPLHEIEISESRKPLLKDSSRHFSISHSVRDLRQGLMSKKLHRRSKRSKLNSWGKGSFPSCLPILQKSSPFAGVPKKQCISGMA
jgi:hypothetical protein